MTGELIPQFEGKDIRAIDQNGEVWMPLSDLATAWGIDRSTPDHILERNADVFEGLSATVLDVTYQTAVRCVNERGLYLLMGKVSAGRLKHKEAREAIIRFQRWVPELIQKYRKKEIVQQPAKPCIADELQKAQMLATGTGGNLRAFQKIALGKCGHADYAPALDAIPTLVHGEPGQWLTPTQIAERVGSDISARNINSFLYNHDYQYPQGSLWRLTKKGEIYGEEYVFESPQKHREVRIRWHISILTASGLIKATDGQGSLLGGAIA